MEAKLIHEPVRTIEGPGAPKIYRGLCTYESEDRHEFRKEKQTLIVVTCPGCLEKMGVVKP